VETIMDAMATESISLDIPVGEDLSLEDYVPADAKDSPLEATQHHLLQQDLKQALKMLSPKERFILLERYGVTSGSKKTLDQIGIKLGFSKERVRQLESRALKKLRSSESISHLKDYLA
jgi:RNA polymerase primary sigma factor